jgi:hypothetical protein
MAGYAYFDGQKWVDGLTVAQAKELAKRGIITESTMIRNPTGQEAEARKFQGFEFGKQAEVVEVPKLVEETPFNPCSYFDKKTKQWVDVKTKEKFLSLVASGEITDETQFRSLSLETNAVEVPELGEATKQSEPCHYLDSRTNTWQELKTKEEVLSLIASREITSKTPFKIPGFAADVAYGLINFKTGEPLFEKSQGMAATSRQAESSNIYSRATFVASILDAVTYILSGLALLVGGIMVLAGIGASAIDGSTPLALPIGFVLIVASVLLYASLSVTSVMINLLVRIAKNTDRMSQGGR